MGLMEEKTKFFDDLLSVYEKEFATFSKDLKRLLYEFIQTGPHAKAEVIEFMTGTGLLDVASGFVSKYDDVIEYTTKVSELAKIPIVLPERSLGILALYKENQVSNILGASESIMNTVTDASLRYGLGEVKLTKIVADMNQAIDVAGRRIITEAHTGAAIYDRTVKFEQFKEADVKTYFYDGPVDDRNRPECEATLGDSRQYTGWTMDDISSSQTPFIACGGYNCRHEWLPFVEGMEDLINEMAEDAGLDRQVNI
jgi:hypothetical protein